MAIWLAAAMAAPAAALAQQAERQERMAPRTVPVYPGAERYEPDAVPFGTTIRETLREDPDGLPLGSKSIDTFIAEVPVATVDAFYRARLGGIASGLLQWPPPAERGQAVATAPAP